MKKHLNQMLANCSGTGVMETGDHKKNGASPKSHTNRKNTLKRTVLLFAVFCVSVASAFAQDIITLKNGDEIQATVLEIGTDEVKYKKFDKPQGPVYVLKKSEVFMIYYADGSMEVLKTKSVPEQSSKKSKLSDAEMDEYLSEVAPIAEADNRISRYTKRPQRLDRGDRLTVRGAGVYNGYMKMTKYEVRNLLSDVPDALDIYNSGCRRRALRHVFFGIETIARFTGIGLILAGIIEPMDQRIAALVGYGLFEFSFLLMIPRLCIGGSAKGRIRNAIKIYNDDVSQRAYTSDFSLNFGITQSGGVGLILKF